MADTTSKEKTQDDVTTYPHPNPVTEERYRFVCWLYLIGRKCRIGIFQLPDHIKGLFEKFMPSKYIRTDDDIQEAVDMWCMDENTCEEMYGTISDWRTSSVTKMNTLFEGKRSFNVDISNWDVSAVTSMECMFQGATSFNADISSWNVSEVTNMFGMFQDAT